MKTNIKIEFVGNINTEYPYLEVFFKDSKEPFLDIGVAENKELSFTFYASKTDIPLTIDEWEYILITARDFLPKVLKNEEDFLNLNIHKKIDI